MDVLRYIGPTIVVVVVLLLLGYLWGIADGHRPSWNAGFEYGIRMYHSVDSDMDVNYLRWEKEKR